MQAKPIDKTKKWKQPTPALSTSSPTEPFPHKKPLHKQPIAFPLDPPSPPMITQSYPNINVIIGGIVVSFTYEFIGFFENLLAVLEGDEVLVGVFVLVEQFGWFALNLGSALVVGEGFGGVALECIIGEWLHVVYGSWAQLWNSLHTFILIIKIQILYVFVLLIVLQFYCFR